MEGFWHRRLNVLGVAVFVAVSVIIFRLAFVQIVHGAGYRRAADANRLREVVQEAPRGNIVDAHGIIMAANQPGFFVSMYHSRGPEVDGVLALLVSIIDPDGLDPQRVSVAEFNRRLQTARFRRWRPVRLIDTALTFGDPRLVAIEERRMELPGVIVDVQPIRTYPLGATAAHVLGGMGRITLTPEEIRARNDRLGQDRYRVDSIVGRWGLEQAYEFEPRGLSLRGVDGFQRLEVDQLSRPVRDLGVEPALPGNDLRLTLDSELQQRIEALLPGQLQRIRDAARTAGVSGTALQSVAREAAVIVTDPRTGAVLSIVSYPSFVPSEILTEHGRLQADPYRPLENKAFAEFPPGSVFKPITEIAGLQHGAQTAMPRVVCAGRLMHPWFGDRGKPCWVEAFGAAHGPMDDVSAMRVSCNVYYYQIGLQLVRQLGAANVLDSFANTARFLGLGVPTDLGDELHGFGNQEGRLPTSERFRRIIRQSGERRPENPYPGEVADIAIGQGIQTYTPMQINAMMSMLATGHRYENFIVQSITDATGRVVREATPARLASLVRTTENPDGLVTAAQWARIKLGLRQVTEVQGLGLNSGTAAAAFAGAGYFVAGKTGTAEAPRSLSHGWFSGWGAVDAASTPEVVVTVFVKHGRGGSLAAAPIAREVLDAYFQRRGAR